jgi:hypothetical protein
MPVLRFIFLAFLLLYYSCGTNSTHSSDAINISAVKGKALLATQYNSLEALKTVVAIQYKKGIQKSVHISHKSEAAEVTSVLKSGINERDITKARDGNVWDKIQLSLRSPYFVANRNDLLRIFILSRRRHKVFGGGDVAFFDLAETMVWHIDESDLVHIPEKDLGEKGYLNTFNHVNAQAFMTSIFTEKFADFIADTHERTNMEELLTGEFSDEQLTDVNNNPVDNYVDIINNEWGQELGKLLSQKYNIDRNTYWTPDLLANYLNDLQSYYSWVFQIGFEPYTTSDEVVVKFSKKLNLVMNDVAGLR